MAHYTAHHYPTHHHPSPPIATPPAGVKTDADPQALATALAEYEAILETPEPAIATFDHSIRIPDLPGRRRCAACSRVFSAAGPTGFSGTTPICDLCLFRGAPQLGMIIALIAVVRGFARSPKAIFETFFQALLELGTFARLYETFADRFGPPRPFDLPGHIMGTESP